ncbi:DUF4389 domain-containing protein [Rhodococcus sp. IEGM 1318]|uniref:DUF4389 domain-containing protein n=1 Tax=Rhodococcus sp. IEGM 1318 TaxID=3082226 RepID=UPI0029548CE6|nr:DUF4389 domain-containing protein [Rhodococcus sp. IEGM 1318]MDV8008689.1 DUF4389 domain-containing protein [Rhodococcus sp. IEGM 1318]
MKPGRIVALVIGCLCALLGFALLSASVFLGWAYFTQNDEGHVTSPAQKYQSSANALVSERIDLFQEADLPEGFSTDDLGRVMLRVTSDRPSKEIFVGIGPREAVDGYLSGVAHTEVTEIEFDPFQPSYRQITGDRQPESPSAQTFWSTSATGNGTQEVQWGLQRGSWTAVVMNADGSPNVAVDIQAGVRLEVLGPLALGVLLAAVVTLAVGIPLVVVGALGLGRHGPPQPHWPAAASGLDAGYVPDAPSTARAPAPSAPYAAHLRGDLDQPLSRWLWLVKWLLAIPHYFVLFFLGLGFVVTTVVAGFAIVFTGRYPRGLFDFNVGVLRWLWRVQFYTYSALGTDRYPPFTLARTDYPADFDVEYPETLSRWLVLVKWWLLAIPHYLILAVLAGGWFGGWRFGVTGDDDGVSGVPWLFGSLLGVLILIAAIVILFTGRYPRPLFDFVMGINRWVYRVIAYAALMRDEYPPFRFDQGPLEPYDHTDPRDRAPDDLDLPAAGHPRGST